MPTQHYSQGLIRFEFTVNGYTLFEQIKKTMQEEYQTGLRFHDSKMARFTAWVDVSYVDMGRMCEYLVSLKSTTHGQKDYVENQFGFSVYISPEVKKEGEEK